MPQPVDFLPCPISETFGISQELINLNLDFIVDQLTTHGFLGPSWNYAYPDNMKNIPKEWEGQLTLKSLLILKNYDRIDYFNSVPQ